MSERRVVSLSMPTAAILARTTTGLNCVPRTAGYEPRHAVRDDWLVRAYVDAFVDRMTVPTAPVAVVPSSPAVAVKAGGVATLTGGDTTQPETQR